MMELDTIFCGDALDVLRTLPDNFVHCCITSPPYYALRDYGVDGQIGREDTPAQYVARLTEVFSEVRRVLLPSGTLWLNIADTYCGTGSKGDHLDPKNPSGRNGQCVSLAQRVENVKAKDMIGIPWMLAFALRDYGWYLRSDIIWQKANPMPESCKDRPSRCYEHVFLLTKSRSYYYDALAIAEPMAPSSIARYKRGRIGGKYAEEIPGQNKVQGLNQTRSGGYYEDGAVPTVRNKRDVWQINPFPYKGGHFAAFPPKLVETCLLAGCPQDGIQRKDGVYFMSTKKLLTLALGSALLVGVVAGCSSSVNIPSDNNTTKNVSYQAQTVSDTENAANDSTTAELPGGSVDYSIYEPYGLSYDQENYYFTYNGNVVRFFNDPIAGASFTNFFSGTVDIEADRDEENNLVGIKECSKENYDRHTQKHNNFNPTDTSLSTVQKGESTPQLWLKDYADYGITYNEQSGGWYYNNQRIKILLDSEQAVVYTDEENGVCVTISRDGNHQISEIKEISETDAQSLMLKNNPIGEDYTSQE